MIILVYQSEISIEEDTLGTRLVCDICGYSEWGTNLSYVVKDWNK